MHWPCSSRGGQGTVNTRTTGNRATQGTRKRGNSKTIGTVSQIDAGSLRFVYPRNTAILGKKIPDTVSAGQIHDHIPQKEMGVNRLNQRGKRPTIFINMGEGGIKLGKLAGKRGFHNPAASGIGLCGNVTEVE